MQPIYGFASGDPLRFKRAAGHKDLFYIEEKDVEFKEVCISDSCLAKSESAVSILVLIFACLNNLR